jgi:hypothetical protein
MNNTKAKNSKKGNFLYAKFIRSSEVPYIIQFLIKKHIVKTERAAIILVFFFICFFIVISAALFMNSLNSPDFISRIN